MMAIPLPQGNNLHVESIALPNTPLTVMISLLLLPLFLSKGMETQKEMPWWRVFDTSFSEIEGNTMSI